MSVDVAVIGAAGQTGRPVVRALDAHGLTVRAVVHHSADITGATETQIADLADSASLTTALSDARVVHFIPPVFEPREPEYAAHVFEAAITAGAERIVYHSVMRPRTPEMPHHWRKAQVEEALRAAPVAWTILQPAMYAETPFAFLRARRRLLTTGFSPDRTFTPVALMDIAEAVAAVVLGAEHERRTYELAGAETLTFRDMATTMAQQWGHSVHVLHVPAALAAAIGSRQFGPTAGPEFRAMLDHYDAAGFAGRSDDLTALLGRAPTTFAGVVASRGV